MSEQQIATIEPVAREDLIDFIKSGNQDFINMAELCMKSTQKITSLQSAYDALWDENARLKT